MQIHRILHLIGAVLVFASTVRVPPARADCDPNNPPASGCQFVPPYGLAGKIAQNVGGTNSGVDVKLTWSYAISAGSAAAPDAIYVQRGIDPLPPIPWNKTDLSKDTTYTDQVRPYPSGSQLIYKVCSWYNSVGYNQNLCLETGVSVPRLPPPSQPKPTPSGNAGGPGCGNDLYGAIWVMNTTPVTLDQFSGSGYTAAVSIGFSYRTCNMPRDLRFRRFTNGAASPDYSFDLDPPSWAPQVFSGSGETVHQGVFYDPVDARTYGQPQTPGLSEHATYRYELCAENAAGSTCGLGSIRIPAPPPEPPTQVSICVLPAGQPCASLGASASAGQGHAIPVRGDRPTLPANAGGLNGPTPAGGNGNRATTSGVRDRVGGAASPGNLTLSLIGYRIEWSPADKRSKRIDVQRYDDAAGGDHWVQVASAPASARSADLNSAPFGYLYRVCFRGEAYDDPAFPVTGPLLSHLANTCSLPIRVPLETLRPPIRFTPPTALGALQPTK